MKPLRILQVCYVYPPSYSGFGRQLATINSALAKGEGAPLIEIITGFDGNRSPDANLRIRALFSRERTAYASDVRSFYLFCLWLPFRLMLSLPFADAVHAVKAGPDAMITVFMARLFRRKVIVKTAQSEFDRVAGAGRIRRLKRGIVLRADGQIAISDKIAADIVHAGADPKRVLRIPNAVDAGRFSPAGRAEKATLFAHRMGRQRRDDEFVFLFLGSITIRKGLRTLLDALAGLHPARSVTMVIAGPDYREIHDFTGEIGRIAARAPLVDAVYLGEQPAPEELIRMSDCLILPSYAEGMPNVVLEAMASGLPVIGSDIDVHRELIGEAHGMLFETGDPVALADRMTRMASGGSEGMGARAREMVLRRYDVAVVSARYKALYERMAIGAAIDKV